MLNFARGIMYMGSGVAFGSFGLFLVTISNSWTERHTETLILWGGILTGSIVLAAIILVVYRVMGNRDNSYDDDSVAAPARSTRAANPIMPYNSNGQPPIILVAPGMQPMGRPDSIYGYGQQQALPPPQGSFDYGTARYELEF